MKINSLCKAILLTLVVTLVFGLVACAPQGTIGNFLDSIQDLSSEADVSEEPSEIEESLPEGQAHAPVITDVLNVTPQQLVITGTCDEGCSVTITDGNNDVTTGSIEGHFVAEYTISTTTFAVLSATAGSDELTTSDITSFRVEYNSTAMKRVDGFGVTVGVNSHFYYDTDLSYYLGKNTLLTQTQIKNFKSFVNIKVTNFQKRAGDAEVQLVYVLIPNYITVYPEYLSEGTEKETYKTRYQQVAEALKETNATAIDMSEAFLAAKEKGEKIYYDTDNHLTEYGGYLVYKAICDMMDDSFPDAAARNLDTDFNAETVTLNGGNIAKSLGVDPKVVTEETTLYTPNTFSLAIGKEDSAIATANGLISDFNKYDDESSMYLASDEETMAARLLFATNRTTLPCALIYRDDFAVTFSDILAERFNRVLLAKVDDFTINMTDAQRYYGKDLETGADKTTVDYIFIIISESNLGDIIG